MELQVIEVELDRNGELQAVQAPAETKPILSRMRGNSLYLYYETIFGQPLEEQLFLVLKDDATYDLPPNASTAYIGGGVQGTNVYHVFIYILTQN